MTTSVQSTWLNDVSGTWATKAYWSGDVAPNDTSDDEYDVTLGGTATSGTSAFTVTSSAKETIGFLTIGSNATLDIAKGIFSIDSEINSYTATYNSGTIEVAKGAEMTFSSSASSVFGELWNAGAFTLDGTLAIGTPTFQLYGPAGSLTMTEGKIIGADGAVSVSFENIDSDITGSGAIGTGASLTLINHADGIINANAATSLTLNTGTNTIVDAGTIETTGTGGLVIESNMQMDGQLTAEGKGALIVKGAYLNGGGDINVLSGGKLDLHQGQLGIGGPISISSGGTISTTTGDTIGIASTNILAGDVIDAGEIDDDDAIVVLNDSTLNLEGNVFGTGALDLRATSAAAILEVFGSTLNLDGAGKILLSDSAKNSIVSNGSAVELSDKTETIEGAGTIGDNWLKLYVSPSGKIIANDSVGLIIAGDTAGVAAGKESENYNAGTMETTGVGGLTLEGGTLNNAGFLMASGTGALTLNNAQIDNGDGITEATGAGTIVLLNNSGISNQAYLSVSSAGSVITSTGDVSDKITSAVENSGTIKVVAGSTLIADNTWVNNGSINIGGTASSSTLDIAAGTTFALNGNGALNLLGAGSSILSGGATTTFENRGNTISGSGQIGDPNMTIYNQVNATIDATGSAGLKLDCAPPTPTDTFLANLGTIESNSAGGVTFQQAFYSPGKLIANTNGDIVADFAVYGTGTTTINGSGSVQFDAENDTDVYFGAGGSGTLILEDPGDFRGAVWGYTAGDTIDLSNFGYNSTETELSPTLSQFGQFDGVLAISNGASTCSLVLQGNYTAANLSAQGLTWQFSSDGHAIGNGQDGTLIKLVSGSAAN